LFARGGAAVPLVLDGQVADAFSRVEAAVGLQGTGRTGADAAVAGGARARACLVRFQLDCGYQFAQEDLGTECRVDQHVIGPDETETRTDRQGPFGQRDRVHAGFESISPVRPRANEIRQFEQPRFYELVIIFIPCVLGCGRTVRLVVQSHDDHRLRPFE
jgi:hypothetical protein